MFPYLGADPRSHPFENGAEMAFSGCLFRYFPKLSNLGKRFAYVNFSVNGQDSGVEEPASELSRASHSRSNRDVL